MPLAANFLVLQIWEIFGMTNSKLIWWFNAAGLRNVANRSPISHNNICRNELKYFLKSFCYFMLSKMDAFGRYSEWQIPNWSGDLMQECRQQKWHLSQYLMQWAQIFSEVVVLFLYLHGCLGQPIFLPFKYGRYSEWHFPNWYGDSTQWDSGVLPIISGICHNIWHNFLKSLLKLSC